MRYEYEQEQTHIYCGKLESERKVLRAIAKATFETVAAIRMGLLQYDSGTVMSDEQADSFIDLKNDDRVLSMDYVQGRQVKTFIARAGKKHFVLHNWSFERDRGKPQAMLDRAKELLGGLLGGVEATGQASTMDMFKGENLDLRLKQFGLERLPGESDWNFRKRIFPDLYEDVDHEEAVMVLFGATIADLTELDALLMMTLTMEDTSRSGLIKFAEGFATDPIEMREGDLPLVGQTSTQ